MPLAPTWCVNRAPRAGSGQAQNELAGLSQACISSEGPGQAREVQPPSAAPAYSSPMETCRRTPPWLVCFPSARGSGPLGQPHVGCALFSREDPVVSPAPLWHQRTWDSLRGQESSGTDWREPAWVLTLALHLVPEVPGPPPILSGLSFLKHLPHMRGIGDQLG